MRSVEYGLGKPRRRSRRRYLKFVVLSFVLVGGYFGYRQLTKPTPQQVVENRVVFDSSFSESEKQKVSDAIINQSKNVSGITTAQIQTTETPVAGAITIDACVRGTSVYSIKQQITKRE